MVKAGVEAETQVLRGFLVARLPTTKKPSPVPGRRPLEAEGVCIDSYNTTLFHQFRS
jgi:hypothetical protein